MLTLSAICEDVGRWYMQERVDILQYLEPPLLNLWISPTSGVELPRCPFVRHGRGHDIYAGCFYETLPTVCRNYPTHDSQMRSVACEMLEDGNKADDIHWFMARERGRDVTVTT